jgi:ABC-2 type transport system permease protein
MFRAELLKLRSTRAPWVVGAVALAGAVLVQSMTLLLPRLADRLGGLGGTSSEIATDLVPDLTAMTDLGSASVQRGMLDLLGNGPSGAGSVGVATLCLLILGVLAGTTDFRTGGVVPTALVVPSRTRVLLGKAAATAVAALVIGVALAVVSALGLAVAIATTPGAGLAVSGPDALATWARGLCVLVALAWLGLGVGVLVRGQVAAIVIIVGLAFVEPLVQATVALLSGGTSAAMSWLPLTLGSLASTGPGANGLLGGAALGAGAALAGLTVWVVVVLGGGAVMFRHRDLT